MIFTAIGGFFMALADSVPGVSGGTIAFIMGFYDKFISSINSLIYGKMSEKWQGLKFLLKIAVGWIIGFVLAVSLLASVFTSGIYMVSSLFLGFVIASIPLIISEEKETIKGKYYYLIFTAIGAAVVIALSSLNLSSLVQTDGFSVLGALYVVVAGAFAILAMVLPGISGSTLLMAFGIYVPIITAVKDVMHLHFGDLWMVIALLIGIIIGALLGFKGINALLTKHRSIAIYAIIGMLLGSIYAIIVGPKTLEDPQPIMSFSTFNIPMFLVGILAIAALTFFKTKVEKNKKDKELKK